MDILCLLQMTVDVPKRRRQVKAIRVLSLATHVVALLLCCCASVRGDDWPQWRGPNRNGISDETGWLVQWPPVENWRVDVGEGYSGVTVKDGRVYTMGWSSSEDTVLCLDAATGTQIWDHVYSIGSVQYSGTRCTPTIDGDCVYTCSHRGHFYCLDRVTGAVLWDKKLSEANRNGSWGYASSPLVEGDLIILCVASGKGTAIDKNPPHDIVWSNPSTKTAQYSSPIAFTWNSQRLVALTSRDGLEVMNPLNGSILWSYSWPDGYLISDPILYDGNKLFVTTAYGRGGAQIQLNEGGTTTKLWSNYSLDIHVGLPVLVGDYMYGFDGKVNGDRNLRCIDARDGSTEWSQKLTGFGAGTVTAADGKIIVLGEGGQLTVINASPTGYDAEGRTPIDAGGDPEWWTVPTLADGNIYVRSHDGTLVSYRVGPAPAPEMDVEIDGVPIAAGTTNKVIQTQPGVAKRLTFDILNAGTAELTISYNPRFLIRNNTNCVTVAQQTPDTTVAAEDATALVVDVTPSSSGPWSFDVEVTSNDDDESSYGWTTEGMATDDQDGDGMRDSWEITHFGDTNAVGGAPLEDWDKDGFLNRHEYEAGTDPTNAASRLIATEAAPARSDGVVVAWQSASNKQYAIRCWTSLVEASAIVASNIPATPPINRYTNDAGAPRGFYRIELE